MSRRDEGKYVLRPVGWGPFRMPGERKRLERLTKKYEEIFEDSPQRSEQAVVPLPRPRPKPPAAPTAKPLSRPKAEVPHQEIEAAPERPADVAAPSPWQPPPQPVDDDWTMPLPVVGPGQSG